MCVQLKFSDPNSFQGAQAAAFGAVGLIPQTVLRDHKHEVRNQAVEISPGVVNGC